MENPVSHLVHDQNLNIHSAGGASLGRKVDIPRAAKKGALGGRKALNDISNSGKPSALQASKKHNLLNVIPVGKDDIGGSKNTLAVGGKANLTKGSEKVKGRKALSDLTNSVKPSAHHLSKKDQEKKLNVTAEESIPSSIKEEGFLHNHQECITAQRKGMNFEYFLESVGLGNPLVLLQPLNLKKPESPVKHLEMDEEIPIPVSPQNGKAQFPDYSLPLYESPKSIKCSAYEFWKDEENLTDLKLIESPPPKLQKALNLI